MDHFEQRKADYLISTDQSKLNLDTIYNFISTSYWAKNIPREVLEKSIKNSLCFGVYHQGKQVGFARVVSDCATFAYLADVFVVENFRGKKISKFLMESIITHPELQGLRRWVLATRDAHKLYEQFGFKNLAMPDRFMELHNPNVYPGN